MAFTRTALGPHFNEGARLLWGALERAGDSVREVDRVAAANQGMAIRWLYGDGRPGTAFRVRLSERYGVPILAWDQPPTAPFVVPALREPEPDELAPVVTEVG